MRVSFRFLLCCALLAAFCSVVLFWRGAGASPEADAAALTGDAPAASQTQPGVKAFVDEKGNLTAAPQAARAPEAGTTRSFSRFTTEPTARGGVLVNFNDGWQNAAIAHVGPDGTVCVECVPAGSSAAAAEEQEE